MKKVIVFECRKCEDLLYVKNTSIEELEKIAEMPCPTCGEEGEENWILVGSKILY